MSKLTTTTFVGPRRCGILHRSPSALGSNSAFHSHSKEEEMGARMSNSVALLEDDARRRRHLSAAAECGNSCPRCLPSPTVHCLSVSKCIQVLSSVTSSGYDDNIDCFVHSCMYSFKPPLSYSEYTAIDIVFLVQKAGRVRVGDGQRPAPARPFLVAPCLFAVHLLRPATLAMVPTRPSSARASTTTFTIPTM